jgi:hypothetical protein
VLTLCERSALDVEPLMTLLRRFATEAAREEARMLCDQLVDMPDSETEFDEDLSADPAFEIADDIETDIAAVIEKEFAAEFVAALPVEPAYGVNDNPEMELVLGTALPKPAHDFVPERLVAA